MSLDSIQKFIYDTTNNNLLASKGSFYSLNKEIYNLLLNTEYKHIQNELMNALVLHVDKSPVKINEEQYYLHNISDGKHTLQYVTKHRSQDAIEEFGSLKEYKGTIVHDYYKMYYNYGTDNAECNIYVLRYLNVVSEFTNHVWSKDLHDLLLEMKNTKEEINFINRLIKPCTNLLLFLKKFFVPFSSNRAWFKRGKNETKDR